MARECGQNSAALISSSPRKRGPRPYIVVPRKRGPRPYIVVPRKRGPRPYIVVPAKAGTQEAAPHEQQAPLRLHPRQPTQWHALGCHRSGEAGQEMAARLEIGADRAA